MVVPVTLIEAVHLVVTLTVTVAELQRDELAHALGVRESETDAEVHRDTDAEPQAQGVAL